MDDRVYWIWLQHAFGAGSPMPWRLHQRIPGGVEGFYRGGPRLWNSLPEINDQAAAALYSFSLAEAQAQLEYAIKVGWRVITPGSPCGIVWEGHTARCGSGAGSCGSGRSKSQTGIRG